MARIDLVDLAHSYAGNDAPAESFALKPITMTWRRGGAYALLGPSGCGKTTLLNLISGIVTPSRGQILFDGVDITAQSTQKRNIAQVFQFPVIYDTMTVGQNLAFPLKNRGMPKAAIDARVAEIAALLDLTPYLSRKAQRLTADAKQKISLGRGLVRSDVAAVLFDEPLTVIDPELKWQLRSKLKALHRDLDLTMIYVTHDQTEALTFADTVVVMHDGRVVQSGTPAELFDRPAHTFVGYFIGSPGMNIVPAEVKGREARINGHPIALDRNYDRLPTGAKIEFGVRPEFVQIAPPAPDLLAANIERIDDLGRVRFAHLRLGDIKFVARVPPGVSIPGEVAGLKFDPARVHVYADVCSSRGWRDEKDRQQACVAVGRSGDDGRVVLVAPADDDRRQLFGSGRLRKSFLLERRTWFKDLLDPYTEIGSRFSALLNEI